ncbi:MAG: hypothetical protein XD93_0526 [candidate division WS6 bacterium 34_10]|uniref:Uncharacterized protein n=1 Tax=candidate division WS6 bacterium 34_10 TaxID=1641389 RepID=A0A101HI52_9BACT|nr:MAG: hypothetical protein XD93_0526 [candidate division WS6 bacterium 34_10]
MDITIYILHYTVWLKYVVREYIIVELIRDSSMVEQAPVKRWVVGSSPTRGASF